MDRLSSSISSTPAPESMEELQAMSTQLNNMDATLWNMQGVSAFRNALTRSKTPVQAIHQRLSDQQTLFQRKVEHLQGQVESAIGLLSLGGAILPYARGEKQKMLDDLSDQADNLKKQS